MDINRKHNKDIDLQKWDDFIRSSPEGMIYSFAQFLNHNSKDWEAYIVSKGDQWQMVFPFIAKRKGGMKYIMQPRFTQYQGPLFREFSSKLARTNQVKNKALKLLSEQLKQDFHYVNINCSPQSEYLTPFHWAGFRMSPRYTYQLALEGSSSEEIRKGVLTEKVDLDKAENNGFIIKEVKDAKQIVEIFKKTKGDQITHIKTDHYEKYAALANSLHEAHMFMVLDANNVEVGGCILYQYNDTTTFAFSTVLDEYKSEGIMPYLIWNAIEFGFKNGSKVFDFEGSMLENVERLFRRFGAHPVPYIQLQHARWKVLYKG